MITGFSGPDYGPEQQKSHQNRNETAEEAARAERLRRIVANAEIMRILYKELYAPGADPNNDLIRYTLSSVRLNQSLLLRGEPLAVVVPIAQSLPAVTPEAA